MGLDKLPRPPSLAHADYAEDDARSLASVDAARTLPDGDAAVDRQFCRKITPNGMRTTDTCSRIQWVAKIYSSTVVSC